MAATPAKRKFGDVNTVTFFVGQSKTTFHVHEDILRDASPVFKAAFDSKFKEGTERTMDLPEEDADLFDVFVSWLYGQTIKLELCHISASDDIQEQLMQTARLFVFADKYQVDSLQKDICELIFRLADNQINIYKPSLPSFDVLTYVYANTRRQSLIRSVLADWFSWTKQEYWKSEGVSTDWLYEIPDFCVDLALALHDLYQKTSKRPRNEDDRAEYLQKLRDAQL